MVPMNDFRLVIVRHGKRLQYFVPPALNVPGNG